MFTGMRLAVIAAVAGLVVGLAAGGYFGFGSGYNNASNKANAVIAEKNKELKERDADLKAREANLGNCIGANQRYTEAVQMQLQQVNAQLQADAAAKIEAEAKNARSGKAVLDAAQKSAENSSAAREAILHAAQECLRRGVSADFAGLLNSITDPVQAAGAPARSDALPHR